MTFTIEVLGLGAGDINQLPLGIYKKLQANHENLFVRTEDHPVIEGLKQEGISFQSFDHYYEKETQFTDVYENIAAELLNKAKESTVIFAVPGHPMLAERTVQILLNQSDIEIKITGGQSYLDDLFTLLKIDPIEGLQFIDGISLERSQLNYRQHTVLCQVYDRFVASHAKLILLEDLPAEYPISIVHAAGSADEKVMTVPLKELDHSFEPSNLTSIYISPVSNREILNHTFDNLREIISTLRGPHGCPWDKKQTHETLRKYVIEETYELIDAIDRQDDNEIVEELGDVLLQVMLHSQIGEDMGYFTVDDVIRNISNKMIHRHPHVFKDKGSHSIDEVNQTWEERKQEEKGERNSLLDGISTHLPSLAKSSKLQNKAAQVGFNWIDVNDIWSKLDEELLEVKQAINTLEKVEVEKELGDVLFVIANIARFYEVNPEVALNRTNQKFIFRFQYIEKRLRLAQRDINHVSLKEMDEYWEEAKGEE